MAISLGRLRHSDKRRPVMFVPDWSARSDWGRLEGRSLAAPAIYLLGPPMDPPGTGDFVYAGTGSSSDTEVQSATSSSAVTSGTTTGVAKADIGVLDLQEPTPPASPVGQYGISFASSVVETIAGTGNGMVGLGAGTTLSRSYVLADSNGTGDTAAYVTEKFTLQYTNPTSSIGLLQASLTTPGLSVTATVGNVTIGVGNTILFQTAEVPTGKGSDTITFGLETIKFSASATNAGDSVNVTETQPVGALPGAGWNSNGTAVGVPWGVNYSGGIGIYGTMNDGNTLKSTYSLSISSTPPA